MVVNQPFPPYGGQYPPPPPQGWGARYSPDGWKQGPGVVQPPPPPGYYPPYPQVVVNNVGPSRSVTKQRKQTSHGLHLFLTIITVGMWGLFVWLPLTMWHAWGPRRRVQTRHY